ncbi:hypothetical protein ACMYYO_01690 [Dermacoccaceae bacterium W4C1]
MTNTGEKSAIGGNSVGTLVSEWWRQLLAITAGVVLVIFGIFGLGQSGDEPREGGITGTLKVTSQTCQGSISNGVPCDTKGTFTADNGTTYTDFTYGQKSESGAEFPAALYQINGTPTVEALPGKSPVWVPIAMIVLGAALAIWQINRIRRARAA